MPDLTDAAHQARVLARRGAHAAGTLIDASFHPFRTVRTGTETVRNLIHPAEDEAVSPPPTDAKAERTSSPAPAPAPRAPREPVENLTEELAEEAAPPPDLPVEPQGPAPHMPARLASEIERDYGDDLPGFTGGDAAQEG
jgi:hypothetical protein